MKELQSPDESMENQSPTGSKNNSCKITSFKKTLERAGSDVRGMFTSLSNKLDREDWLFCRKITHQQLKDHGNPEI